MYIPKSNFCTVEFSLDLSLGECMSMFVQRLVVHIALQKVLIKAKASIKMLQRRFLGISSYVLKFYSICPGNTIFSTESMQFVQHFVQHFAPL